MPRRPICSAIRRNGICLWKLLAARALECALAIGRCAPPRYRSEAGTAGTPSAKMGRAFPLTGANSLSRGCQRIGQPRLRPRSQAVALTELVDGVKLSLEGGMLVAHIRGAKVDVARGKG
jgi:hypothetical protein